MRRADRLFQIIQILRRSSNPITATALAAELETEGVGRKNRRHLGAGPHS
jgi:predicted DNA-binding transcriptional regulator YafY